MRKLILALGLALACCATLSAAQRVEASTLNLIGKPFEATPNPYQRVDTVAYKGFNTLENCQMRCPAGMAVLFRTNTTSIKVTTEWGYMYTTNSTMPVAYKGYDLYIKNAEGQWQYAASGSLKKYKGEKVETFTLIEHMDGTMHECMMYMPMYSEVRSCVLEIDDEATIAPLASEFRHRIAVYGSSFTQGVGADRAGMSYPMQLMRNTGIQVVSLATSGRCLMQPYMANVLADVKADAFIFDTFSNPNAEQIRERLMPFIDRMVAAHPGTPLIFQRTIYRERRSFNTHEDAAERAKAAVVEEMFAKILTDPRYKDVYLITPKPYDRHETVVDGLHPNSYGYSLWARSIEGPVLTILAKYGLN